MSKRFEKGLDELSIIDNFSGWNHSIRNINGLLELLNGLQERVDNLTDLCLSYYPLTVDMTIFEKKKVLLDIVYNMETNLENEIMDFIGDVWNPDLNVFIDCDDGNDLVISVFGKLNVDEFERWVINPIKKRYGLDVTYVEHTTTSNEDSSYIEWGLDSVNE